MTQPPEPDLSIELLQGLLAEWFAPWIQAMGLQVESWGRRGVTPRVAPTEPH